MRLMTPRQVLGTLCGVSLNYLLSLSGETIIPNAQESYEFERLDRYGNVVQLEPETDMPRLAEATLLRGGAQGQTIG